MGLPLINNPVLCGNLFVQFEIEFPKSLGIDDEPKIAKILSNQKPKQPPQNLGLE